MEVFVDPQKDAWNLMLCHIKLPERDGIGYGTVINKDGSSHRRLYGLLKPDETFFAEPEYLVIDPVDEYDPDMRPAIKLVNGQPVDGWLEIDGTFHSHE